MDFLIALIGLSSLSMIPISCIGFIVQAIRKKSKKGWGIICVSSILIFLVAVYIPVPCSHEWEDATCTEPKICKICGEIESEALGHQSGEWSEWDIDYDEAASIRELGCTRCEIVIDTESKDVTSFVGGDYLTIYPAAFADRFENSSSRLNDIDYYAKSEYNEYGFYDEDNTIFYRIQDKNNDYKDIGIMSFSKPDGKSVAVMNNYTENCIGCINILIEESYDVSAVVYSAILATDPSIGYSEG